MANKPLRSAYKLVYPEGVNPEHANQVIDLMIRFNSLEKAAQDMFCRSLIADGSSFVCETVTFLSDLCAQSTENAKMLSARSLKLQAALVKHRNPRRNAARDAEIMRLNSEGKTAGQIVRLIADRWVLSDNAVNAVISRERKKNAKN